MHILTEYLFYAIDAISDRHIEECAVFDKARIEFDAATSYETRNPQKRNIRKIALIAAIIAVLFAIMVAVTATGGKNTELEEISMNVREGIYTLHYQEVESRTLWLTKEVVMIPSLYINSEAMLSTPEKFSDEAESLVALHIENGFEKLVLPSALSSQKWVVSEKNFTTPGKEHQHWISNITLQSDKGFVKLYVSRKIYIMGSALNMSYNSPIRAESVILNGLDVVIVEQDGQNVNVSYHTCEKHNNVETECYSYYFSFYGYTFEEVAEIVKTLP